MIPFLDLQAQYRSIKHEIDPAIQQVIDSCQFVLGGSVASFEEAFAEYCGTRCAIAVNSGTSALHLALLAAGVGPGDEVVTSAMTFAATAGAIEYVGARPVLVDVDPRTYNIAPDQIEAAIGERTAAVIPVHLYGQPADMDPILEIARRAGVRVIEDACQAHGARYKDRPVGGLGELGCFSFYPGKNLGAYGEGGMVVTNDESHARTVRTLRDLGQEEKYRHVLKGFNYRMDGIQGAVLGVKLRHLEDWNVARRAHAARYHERLADGAAVRPETLADVVPVHHIYALKVQNRSELRKALESRGIASGVHYPVPIHLHPAFADLGYGKGRFPVAERLADEELSLPIYPEMTEAQVDEVAAAVCELAR